MNNFLARMNNLVVERLWGRDLGSAGKLTVLRVKSLRVLYIVVQGLKDEQLAMRSMSLVYTTLFALVPLLAVSFSALKAFGIHTRVEIFLYYFLEPLGPRGVDLSMKIIEFVENVKAGVLGSIGISLLIYTLVTQIQKLEDALNKIWNVRSGRSFARKFSNYISVLVIGPILIISALGITASLKSAILAQKILSIRTLGALLYYGGQIMPYLLAAAAFTFIYISLPNTRVKFVPALTGGLLAGIVWKLTGLVFTAFIVSSSKYSAIYSGFAVLALFLLWLYWSWLILLVGARVAFYFQYPVFFAARETVREGTAEKLALMIMFLIGSHFYHNRKPWDLDSLIGHLGYTPGTVRNTLEALERRGLIIRSGGSPPAYVPARDIGQISLKEVIYSVRLPADQGEKWEYQHLKAPGVDAVVQRVESAISDSLEKETVKSLVLSNETLS